MPSRNAPTAADTCSCEATPATSNAEPSSLSRNTSWSGLSTMAEMNRPYFNATTRTTVMASSEMPTDVRPPRKLTPDSTAVRTGR